MDGKLSSEAPTSEEATLFDLGPPQPRPARPALADPKRGARLRQAERSQLAWGRIDLDAQLPEDHCARVIWAVIEQLDLSVLYAQIVTVRAM